MYRNISALTVRLQAFQDGMENIVVTGNHREELDQIARVNKENSTTFARDFRPDLVRLAADLRQHYGLVHLNLTDQFLSYDVYAAPNVDPYLLGLRDMIDKVRDMIVNKALEIDA
jgi:hypothetical protein